MYYFKTYSSLLVVALLCISYTNDINAQNNNFSTYELVKTVNSVATQEVITNTISKINELETAIKVKYINSGPINPYSIDYEYKINKIASDYQVDMISLLDPMLTRYDKTKSQLSYTGEKLFYNISNLSLNNPQTLNGKFSLKLNNIILVTYDIGIKNRLFTKTEKMLINQVEYTAYVYQSVYTCFVKSNEKLIQSKDETVIDYFIPTIGIVKIERIDNKNNHQVLVVK